MPPERARILELALENLESKKKRIDMEIEKITREMRGRRRKVAKVALIAPVRGAVRVARKRSRFSKEERLRRSTRMKAYWDNWRKQKKAQK